MLVAVLNFRQETRLARDVLMGLPRDATLPSYPLKKSWMQNSEAI